MVAMVLMMLERWHGGADADCFGLEHIAGDGAATPSAVLSMAFEWSERAVLVRDWHRFFTRRLPFWDRNLSAFHVAHTE